MKKCNQCAAQKWGEPMMARASLSMNWIFRNIMSLAHIECYFYPWNQHTATFCCAIMILSLIEFNHKCVAFVAINSSQKSCVRIERKIDNSYCYVFIWLHRWYRSNTNILNIDVNIRHVCDASVSRVNYHTVSPIHSLNTWHHTFTHSTMCSIGTSIKYERVVSNKFI